METMQRSCFLFDPSESNLIKNKKFCFKTVEQDNYFNLSGLFDSAWSQCWLTIKVSCLDPTMVFKHLKYLSRSITAIKTGSTIFLH